MAGPTVTATIEASDHASATLRAIAKLANDVAKNIEKTGHANGLANSISSADLAANRHLSTLSRMRGVLSEITASAKAAASAYAAWKIPQLTGEALKAGAALQHAEIGLQVAGIPEAELAKLRSTIGEAQVKIPGVTTEAALELGKELRSILLHTSEVPEMLPVAMRAKASIDAADPTGASSHGLGFLFKGAELLGYAQDPEKFERYVNAGVKAMQVMGRLINPEQIFEIAKYEKASGAKLSERFQFTTALSLAQELGGSTVGQSVDQFLKTVQGAVQNHQALKEALALGLVRNDDVLYTAKTHEAKGLRPGATWFGAEKAMSDPDKYIWENVVPALRSKGFDTQEKMIPELRKLFPAGRAADFAIKAITQQASFENHAKLYEAAQGLSAADTYLKDAGAALKTFGNVLTDFAAVATEPAMKPAAGVLADISLGLSKLKKSYSEWSKDHGDAATALGVSVPALGVGATALATWSGFKALRGLLSGAALDGSAAALTGSAAALTEAAAALSGSAVVSKATTAATPLATAATAAASRPYLGGAFGWLTGLGMAGYLSYEQMQHVKGANELPPQNFVERWADAFDKAAARRLTGGFSNDPKLRSEQESAAAAAGKVVRDQQAMLDDIAKRKRVREESAVSSLGSIPKGAFISDGAKANGGRIEIPPLHVEPVHGEVHGEVQLMNKIIVEPSPLLQAIVREAQQAKAIVHGSLGYSPDMLGQSGTADSGIKQRSEIRSRGFKTTSSGF